uniref:Glycoside hydrolase 35 catalytic domain-containing protein n=1 Tax=Romanomermis culicivorax TaxID=13658 RepID=A0A915HF10_ROMCU
MNGASSDNEPVTTSYDYDAPLSEAGDPTPKFYAIKSKIETLTGLVISNSTIPPPTPKTAFGKVPLSLLGDVNSLLETLASMKFQSAYPKTFEQLDYPYGFVIYETNINFPCKCNISAPGINDRGYVMVDGLSIGTLIVRKTTWITTKDEISKNSVLRILVENNGRQCSGFNDPKGLNGNVTADGQILTNWTMYPLTIENIFNADKMINRQKARSMDNSNFTPSIYYGKFAASQITDTFFDPSNWGKGQFFLNQFNVGRYWPSLGPQVTLYVPRSVVKKLNYVVLLELEEPGNCRDDENFVCEINFLDRAILNKTVIGRTKGRYVKNVLIKRGGL